MTEDPAPGRLAVNWSPEARADLRAIGRETAMQILYCLDRYLASRAGDVKKLKPPRKDFHHAIEITGVRNRREAYR